MGTLIALTLFQVLIFLIAQNVVAVYKGIFTLGTYLAIHHERTEGPRWHRMRRQYSDYHAKARGHARSPSIIRQQWGGEVGASAALLFSLNVVSCCIVYFHYDSLSLLWVDVREQLFLAFFVSVLIGANFYQCQVLARIEQFRQRLETSWVRYAAAFGDNFKDQFSEEISLSPGEVELCRDEGRPTRAVERTETARPRGPAAHRH